MPLRLSVLATSPDSFGIGGRDGFGQPVAADDSDCGECPIDIDAKGQTEAFDLANLLGAWGLCE